MYNVAPGGNMWLSSPLPTLWFFQFVDFFGFFFGRLLLSILRKWTGINEGYVFGGGDARGFMCYYGRPRGSIIDRPHLFTETSRTSYTSSSRLVSKAILNGNRLFLHSPGVPHCLLCDSHRASSDTTMIIVRSWTLHPCNHSRRSQVFEGPTVHLIAR